MEINTEYLIFLIFFVVFILSFIMTKLLKKTTGTYSLAIPLWVMLLWLFKGGVDFSIASLYGVDLRYETELFPISIDSDYLLSYLLYFAYFFCYVIVVYLYASLNKKVIYVKPVDRVGSFYSLNLLYFSLFMVFLYLYYGFQMYQQALGTGLSVYQYSRFNGGTTKSLMTLASWVALSSCVVGIIFYSKKVKLAFYFLLLVVFINSMILGNRHILLSGVILYFVIALDSERLDYKRIIKLGAVFFVVISSIMSIYIIREAQEGTFHNVDADEVTEGVANTLSSSEFVYPHMSMYGVISKDVEVNLGQSFLFLTSAVFPRFISDDREDDIYTYYINKVSPNPFKGFTIANPTGWYLNLGVLGVFLGGALFGVSCIAFHYLCYHYRLGTSLFCILLFSLFLSDSIGFMRSGGPEPFRAVLLVKAVIPAILISFCMRFKFKRHYSKTL